MITYKGDFILSEYDRTEIEIASTGSEYKSSKVVNIDGIGDVVVDIEVNGIKKFTNINITSPKLKNTIKLHLIKYDLFDVIAVYKTPIEYEGKDSVILLNITLDKGKFSSINNYYTNESRILKYKVENQLSGDLLNYINYLDFNYIVNILLAGYIVHTYKLKHIYSPNYDNLKETFVDKLSKVGFTIPTKTNEVSEKISEILELVENKKKVNPYDMVFLLINTLPDYFLSEIGEIKDRRKLYNSISNILETFKGIETI